MTTMLGSQRVGWRRWLVHGLLMSGVMVMTVNCFPGQDGALDFAAFEMRSFNDCDELEAHLKERAAQKAELQSVASIAGRSWSPAGFADNTPGDTSATNNQERGVDEADVFKVDERYAYALHGGKLVIAEAEGSGSGERFQIASARVVSQTPIQGQAFEMHLAGDKVLVMARTEREEIEEHFQATAVSRDKDVPVFKAMLFDVSNRAEPKVLRELLLEGDHLASRRIGDKVHLVTQAMLGGPAPSEAPSGGERWLTGRYNAIRVASIDSWLPSFYDVRYQNGQTETDVERCSCRDTWQSPSAEGDDLIVIYTVDLSDAEKAVGTSAIIGEGGHVYASTSHLVVGFPNEGSAKPRRVATPDDEDPFGDDPFGDDPFNDDAFAEEGPVDGKITHLHQFDIGSGGKIDYSGSGEVEGWILNQFSMSEHNNVLRVATMTGDIGASNARSHIFTLKTTRKQSESYLSSPSNAGSPDVYLKVLGELRNIAPDEDLYSTRFRGNTAYLITFRETDPLWTIDLSDPSEPRVLGELMVPGYSTYIHPISDDRLLAVGRGGWQDDEGLKLSLFDVSRLSAPSVVEEHVFGDQSTQSEALEEHRAFNYMESYGVLAIPVEQRNASNLQLWRVKRNTGFNLLGVVDHRSMAQGGDWTVRRSLLSGHYLWALSEAGLSITDMDSMEDVAFLDLPDGQIED